jgi:hypothetical protein
MARWEERIERGSDPSIVVEHVVRYRFALPLISGADLWIDLGCGSGYPAALATAMLEAAPRRTLLVDVDPDAAKVAAGNLAPLRPDRLEADLAEAGGRNAIAAAIRATDAERLAISCFETLEHLEQFSGVVAWLRAQVEQNGADVVLSVPNEAFWTIENPIHKSTWGEGAFAELLSMLPEHTAWSQFPVNGSWIAAEGDDSATTDIRAEPGDARVPSHFLVALGPHRERLRVAAGAMRTDLRERRRWEREREARLSWLEQRVGDLEQAPQP